jgi:hypothetical protein
MPANNAYCQLEIARAGFKTKNTINYNNNGYNYKTERDTS